MKHGTKLALSYHGNTRYQRSGREAIRFEKLIPWQLITIGTKTSIGRHGERYVVSVRGDQVGNQSEEEERESGVTRLRCIAAASRFVGYAAID